MNALCSNLQVLVIGCGVSGLSSGIRLLESGFSVRIIAHSIPPHTTSDKAAAIWYPYRAYPEDKVLQWSESSFRVFSELCKNPGSGVSMTEFRELFDQQAPDPWWISAVEHFRRLKPAELPSGYCDGYAADVPLITTPTYMPYLVDRFRESGGVIDVLSQPLESLEQITSDYDLVVNCTGLGAGKLTNDPEVFPIRGQIVVADNPGVNHSTTDDTGPLALSYVVAREHDCVLGGTATPNDWNENNDPATTERILDHCGELDPRLRDCTVLDIKTGLRPGRSAVRLEMEQSDNDRVVIHNYGHGGAGFTLSWGCADEVVELLQTQIKQSALD